MTDALVTLCCSRCGRRLVPILGAWKADRDVGTRPFLCPALAACGFGGAVEDLTVLATITRN